MTSKPPNIVNVSGVAKRAATETHSSVVRFGEEESGLYLGGQASRHFHTALTQALAALEEGRPPTMHDATLLRNLASALAAPELETAQQLKPFTDCLDG